MPGVGAGTLYRNFPTREALLLAVYQDEVDRILAAVADLLAAAPAARSAPRRWTTGLVEAMRRKHGLGDALSPGAHQAITERTYGPVVAAIAEFLDAGKKDGTHPRGRRPRRLPPAHRRPLASRAGPGRPVAPHARPHPRRPQAPQVASSAMRASSAAPVTPDRFPRPGAKMSVSRA